MFTFISVVARRRHTSLTNLVKAVSFNCQIHRLFVLFSNCVLLSTLKNRQTILLWSTLKSITFSWKLKHEKNETKTGLGGEACLVDLGGVPYLLPTAQRDRVYDLADLPALMNLKNGSVLMIGAGAGPWQHLGTNCEMMTNLSLPLDGESGKMVNSTRLATVDPAGQASLHLVPAEQTGCALLNNLLVTRGLPGTQVLRIRCHKRTGPDNFVTSMRRSIGQHYGNQPVGQFFIRFD